MDKEKLEIAVKEMLVLYEQGNLEELAKIRDNNEESGERIIAAHKVLQMGPDPRRLFL